MYIHQKGTSSTNMTSKQVPVHKRLQNMTTQQIAA